MCLLPGPYDKRHHKVSLEQMQTFYKAFLELKKKPLLCWADTMNLRFTSLDPKFVVFPRRILFSECGHQQNIGTLERSLVLSFCGKELGMLGIQPTNGPLHLDILSLFPVSTLMSTIMGMVESFNFKIAFKIHYAI